jgi:molybdopterin-guanine dinucleotide biosynthesis protein A
MRKSSDLTGIILAGGKSRRMGSNKALHEYNGLLLIEHSMNIINQLTDRIFISGQYNEYNRFDALKVSDNYFDIGPIAGIEACLSKSETNNNLFIPCDTPLLSIELLNSILEHSGNFDAVVPILPDGKVEPLVALYSKKILPVIREQISTGDYQIISLLKKINTKYLAFTNTGYFRNINTPDDLSDLHKTRSLISEMPNLLLIAGAGRNVGKTLFACRIIKQLSKKMRVTAVKISPHFHESAQEQKIISEGEGFRIIEETLTNNKDSSRMKQAGAETVYFVESTRESIYKAFDNLKRILPAGPVVCEAGGVHEIVSPGLFIFVTGDIIPENKMKHLNYNPIIINPLKNPMQLLTGEIEYSNGAFSLKK